MSEGADKELPATFKRRQELRDKGQVIKSADISSTILLATGLFTLMALGPTLATGFSQAMAVCISEIGKTPFERVEGLPPFQYLVNTNLLFPVIIFLFLLVLFSGAAQYMQVGFLITTKPLDFDLSKMNPASGVKKLFSLRRLVQAVTSIVKVTVILAFCYSAVHSLFKQAVFVRPVNLLEYGDFMILVAWEIGWRVLLALATIATIDYLYQTWQFEKDNRMSHQEVKDEFKQTEGSPEIKGKRKELRRRQLKSIKRMMEDMSDSTIVITNPTHYAVALKYIRGETPVPIVVAKGARLIALRIRQKAKELGIPIRQNIPLAQGLYKHSQVGEGIPMLYYQAVAGVLVQLFRRGFSASEQNDESNEESEE